MQRKSSGREQTFTTSPANEEPNVPVFFNPRQLTDTQHRNWDAAVAEYSRVQVSNALDPPEESAQQSDLPGGNIMRATKSALFARLLEGKPALAHPPPTSHAYPWYAVIEEPGPHQVRIDGSIDGQAVSLNRCTWNIRHMNEAARELWALDSATRAGQWNNSLLAKVKAAYAKGPEMLVRFEPWQNYRLLVAACKHTGTQAARPYALDAVRIGVRPSSLTGSVFDVDALMLNAKLGADTAERKPIAGADDWVDLFFDRWHLEMAG